MWETHDGMGWWMLFGGVFWLAVIVLLAYLASTVFGRGAGDAPDAAEPPLDIARRRLAAGEITHEEFERIREALMR